MALTLLLAASLVAAAPTGGDCQAALQEDFDVGSDAPAPGQIDGAAIAGRDGLLALRAERGETPLLIAGGSFAGADFRGARLHNVCFLGTDLAGSDWRGAEAPGIGFIRADLSGANLAGARMPRILLREPHLPNVDASRADFSDGLLAGGWGGSLADVRLDGADLRGFHFQCGMTIDDGCPLDGDISFRGADLSRALVDTYRGVADWTGARLDDTFARLDQLIELQAAVPAGPVLLRAGEETVELSAADLAAIRPHIGPLGEAPNPSFDCAPAAAPVERWICGAEGGTVRALDREVAALYRRAVAADPAVAVEQRQWLRERDTCRTPGGEIDSWCLDQAYERRKAALVARIGPPAWARPGAIALFVAPTVEFDEAFRATPLYRRLVPAMVFEAWSRAVVRVNDDGTIGARGDALGANAHLCSLAGDRLRFDPSTGWYSGPQQPNAEDPPEWRGRPMPVLLMFEDRAEIFRRGQYYGGGGDGDPRFSDYAGCGVRAGFLPMIRVAVPDTEARQIFDSYEAPE